jgi:hypothetical protein
MNCMLYLTKKTIRNLLVRLSWVLLLVAIGEVVCRIFLTSPSNQIPDEHLGFKYVPNCTMFFASEGGARNKINSLGLNSPELNLSSHNPMCLVLGDSFTEALHVKQKDNFCSLAAQNLSELQIVNAGRSDAGPIEYLKFFRQLKKTISPDRVILVINETDLLDLDRQDYHQSPDGRIETTAKPLRKSKALLAPILNQSALATHLARKANIAFLQTKRKSNMAAGLSPKDVSESHCYKVKILNSILKEISEECQTDIIFIPQLDYQPARKATIKPESAACWEAIKEASEELKIGRNNLGSVLIEDYVERGQPAHGFANRKIGVGHLNQRGHQITARELIRILN